MNFRVRKINVELNFCFFVYTNFAKKQESEQQFDYKCKCCVKKFAFTLTEISISANESNNFHY